MKENGNFFTSPLGIFLVVAVIAGVAVGIYFGVRDTNSPGVTTTQNIGQNFRVTYHNTNGTNIQDNYSRHLEEAAASWEDKLNEDVRLELDVKGSYLEDRLILAYASMNDGGDIRAGGDITINLNANAASWTDVLKHEIGHVMGIGIAYKWRNARITNQNENFLSSVDFPETYQIYVDEYGGTEDHTPLGDVSGHFDEDIFTTELMTPFSNEGRRQPITLLTLTAMKELGWDVDLSAAETRN